MNMPNEKFLNVNERMSLTYDIVVELSRELKIEKQRGKKIFDQCVSMFFFSDSSVSDCMKEIMCDFDLDSKEIMFGSYIIGVFSYLSIDLSNQERKMYKIKKM